MTPLLSQQLAERMAQLRAQYGSERRHRLLPFSPMARNSRLRDDVCAKLGIPRVFDAHRTTSEAFKARTGSYAHLLVSQTAEVVEAFMFEGLPGTRARLLDLAAFALILADTFETSLPLPPRSTK